MAKLTPAQAREKHARNLKGATEDIRRGIANVTEAPGVQAAKKVNKMRQNVLAAIDSGKWEKNVAAVPLSEWKEQMTNKGIPRIAAGIDGAAKKMEDFFGDLFPFQDQIQSELESMPDLTLEDGINRAVHTIRRMAEFRRP